jgi:hypothetical protein
VQRSRRRQCAAPPAVPAPVLACAELLRALALALAVVAVHGLARLAGRAPGRPRRRRQKLALRCGQEGEGDGPAHLRYNAQVARRIKTLCARPSTGCNTRQRMLPSTRSKAHPPAPSTLGRNCRHAARASSAGCHSGLKRTCSTPTRPNAKAGTSHSGSLAGGQEGGLGVRPGSLRATPYTHMLALNTRCQGVSP